MNAPECASSHLQALLRLLRSELLLRGLYRMISLDLKTCIGRLPGFMVRARHVACLAALRNSLAGWLACLVGPLAQPAWAPQPNTVGLEASSSSVSIERFCTKRAPTPLLPFPACMVGQAQPASAQGRSV